MTRINLLPWREARRKQQQRNFIGMLGAAAMAALAGVLVTHMQIAGRIEHQEARNQYLRNEIARLDKVEKEIKELDKSKARMLSRLEIIQNLQRSRPGMVKIVDALAQRLPEDIFLSSFTTNGKTLTLTGTASSDTSISAFMRELAASSRFGEPVLRIVEKTHFDDVRASKFELIVQQTTQPKDLENVEEQP